MMADPGSDIPPWLPAAARARVADIEARTAELSALEARDEVERLIRLDGEIHGQTCINLDPAANVMNPRAEAALASGLSTRPSLGAPGAKYETGLEAIEQIEVIAARLARQLFGARYAEVRLGSGAVANLASFMACAEPGDAIIVPPPAIGGHVTHHAPGAAGLYGLKVHPAPVDAEGYTVDLAGVAALAERVRPSLITMGGSLNLDHHPIRQVSEIAHRAGARLLFDAAHLSGPIAGGAWPNPLAEGADIMTMSTYKSLGGPPGALVLSNDAELAARIDAITFPGLTANHDAGRVAALAISLVDWLEHGAAAAGEMVAAARTLAAELYRHDLPIAFAGDVATRSHAFALEAGAWGDGTAMAKRLRRANLLCCPIGIPDGEGGQSEAVRIGTSEIVRRGMTVEDMAALASLMARALQEAPERVADEVSAMARSFQTLRFVET